MSSRRPRSAPSWSWSRLPSGVRRAPLVRFDMLTERARAELGSRGRSLTVSTGCTTSLDALGVAFDRGRLRPLSAGLVVAAEAALTPAVVAGFQRVGALRRGGCHPSGRVARSPVSVTDSCWPRVPPR